MGNIGRWLEDNSYDVLKCTDYQIEASQKSNMFFPADVVKNKKGILKAIKDADYFIFHHVKSSTEKNFISSLDLYNNFDGNAVCITNFYFGPFGDWRAENKFGTKKQVIESANNFILELKKRADEQRNLYGCNNVVDMTEFIEKNWQKFLLQENMCEHPSYFYYKGLFAHLANTFLKELNITNLEPFTYVGGVVHGGMESSVIDRIYNIFPDILIPNKELFVNKIKELT